MKILPILLALATWAASFLVMESYQETTWQCLVSVVLVDVLAMFAFMNTRVHYIVGRWVSAVLFISVFVTALFSVLMYSYQTFIIDKDFLLLAIFTDHYQSFGFIMSVLVLLVSMIPPKIASALDGLYWPNFADDIRYGCDMDRIHTIKDDP